MILDRFHLQDRVALVTGASKGIGRGIALAFAEAGADLVLAARTAGDLERVAAEVRGLGRRALAVPCDVNERAQLEQLAERTWRELGRIDVLVNNAGGTPPKPALRTSEKMFEAALHFNVTSAFLLSRLVIPRMLERDGGAVLNISSGLSWMVDKGFVAYGTAKAALSHMTRLLAFELAPRVRVNAIAVGAIETDALRPFLEAVPAARAKLEAATPMGRIGQPEDVAAAALYLCSPAGAWVTGKIFEVDGGTVASNWPLELPAP
ncbi:MAG: glucose 1-dehydrogenase [Deltaproteobacteria bacterium]|nr:glucose 1-dehydrogenase [Deltaproteobacteria bacterium]